MNNRADLTATDVNNPFASVRNSQIVLPINPYKMRVHLSANQSIANSSPTTVAFDTVDFGVFSTGTNSYTIPLSGYYAVFVKLSWGTATQLTIIYQATLLVNGVNAQGGSSFMPAGGFSTLADGAVPGNAFETPISDLRFFNAGDVLTVQGNQTNGGAVALNILGGGAAGETSYWTMHLISI